MPAPFRFDRTFEFDVPADKLWATLSQLDEFPSWWSWLDEFETSGLDGDGLAPGTKASCVVRPPLPYALRFTVTIDSVRDGSLIEARVSGDLDGPASLTIEPSGVHAAAATARLQWEVALTPTPLRLAATVARPLMVWGHEWVVRIGVGQFRDRALGC